MASNRPHENASFLQSLYFIKLKIIALLEEKEALKILYNNLKSTIIQRFR